jgi:hypothetical protein
VEGLGGGDIDPPREGGEGERAVQVVQAAAVVKEVQMVKAVMMEAWAVAALQVVATEGGEVGGRGASVVCVRARVRVHVHVRVRVRE